MPLVTRMPSAPARTASPADAPRQAPLQRMASAEAGPGARPSLAALTGRGGGQPLPAPVRTGVEALSGVSMAGVTVHYNSERPAEIGALAYAQGAAIHLGRGQERTLAHEAWHVAQQRQGRVRPRHRVDGRPVNDDGHLEREADRMGAAVERLGVTRGSAPPGAVSTQAVQPAMEAHAPIQGFWPFTAAAPAVDQHAPPANIAAQVAAHRQALANAGAPQRTNADWYRQQQDALHATEATVTAWLRDHGGQATDVQRQAVAGHLHDLEDHHTDLVGVQLQHNHPLWLPAGTSASQKRKARQTWASLRNNAGNLTVHGTTPAARNATLADFAKLLQKPHGRRMIRELNSTDQGAGGVARPVEVSNDWSAAFAAAHHREHTPGSWATTHTEDDNANQTPNGSGSYVQVDRANRHEATSTHGDTGIPMPHYVTLGHELGHALRNRRGHHQQAFPHGGPVPQIEQGLWTDNEEYENITQNENAIRGQHGLPLRAYHKPPLQTRVGRGYAALTERVRNVPDTIDPPNWLNPLTMHQDQIGLRPDGTREFDPADPATYGNAGAFFTRANAHLDSLHRWDRVYGVGRGLRARGAAAWNQAPDRWAGPRAVGALARGVWNRLPGWG